MIKRWEITDAHGYQHLAQEFSHGRWVRYEDYAKLEEERDHFAVEHIKRGLASEARISQLEAALQLRCPQCDMKLIERTCFAAQNEGGK